MPSSHLTTGVALRAFASSPTHRHAPAAQDGARLLTAALFERDAYPDRGTAAHWLRFSFPFWFTDLLSALDSLSLIGLDDASPKIQRALEWFRARQRPDGAWALSLLRMNREPLRDLWITFAIARVFRRCYGD